jgi:hypothetical protein
VVGGVVIPDERGAPQSEHMVDAIVLASVHRPHVHVLAAAAGSDVGGAGVGVTTAVGSEGVTTGGVDTTGRGALHVSHYHQDRISKRVKSQIYIMEGL